MNRSGFDRLRRSTLTFSILSCLGIAAVAGLVACGPTESRSDLPPVTSTEPMVDPMPEVEADGRVRIASIFPAYGRFAISGEESQRGVRLAEEDARALGKIHGREIEVLYYRTGSEQIDVREAARRACDAGAVAIVGCNASRLSGEVREIAQIRGIPMVSNVSTVPDLTWNPETGVNHGFVFRVCHNDAVMGFFLADAARGDLGAKSAAVLYDVSRTYSTNLARTFTERFTAGEDPPEVRQYYYAQFETDFDRQLRAIRQFDPDVLFVPGSFTEASLIAVQAEALGLRATLLGGDSWSSRLLFKRKAPTRAVYHADHWFAGGPFRNRFIERYGQEPNGARAALAHDALGVILHALRNLGRLTDRNLSERSIAHTRDRLRQSLMLTVYEGVTGTITFDEHGDPPQKAVIVKVEGGVRTLFKDLEDS